MKTRFVLDASALLALLQREKGSDRVLQVLEEAECFLCSVNLAEIAARLLLQNVPKDKVMALPSILQLQVILFDEELALQTALLITSTKQWGLSLGDRACLATAFVKQATVLTTDKIWKKIDTDLRIELLR